MYQNGVVRAGNSFRLELDANVVNGGVRVESGGALITIDSTGSYTFEFTSAGNALYFIANSAPGDLTLDNISVKEIYYNSSPNQNDTYSSCSECIQGCMDSLAFNYNDSALVDDGSCLYGYNVQHHIQLD